MLQYTVYIYSLWCWGVSREVSWVIVEQCCIYVPLLSNFLKAMMFNLPNVLLQLFLLHFRSDETHLTEVVLRHKLHAGITGLPNPLWYSIYMHVHSHDIVNTDYWFQIDANVPYMTYCYIHYILLLSLLFLLILL